MLHEGTLSANLHCPGIAEARMRGRREWVGSVSREISANQADISPKRVKDLVLKNSGGRCSTGGRVNLKRSFWGSCRKGFLKRTFSMGQNRKYLCTHKKGIGEWVVCGQT